MADHDQRRAMEIKLIQMGKTQLAELLGWSDQDYRAELARLCAGKTSSTALTWQERRRVIERFKELGFVVVSRRSTERRDDTMSKLRAMWFALAEVQAVTKPAGLSEADAAIEAWAKRMQPRLSAIRFASDRQMQTLIESMKKWCKRVGAPTQ